MYDCGVVYKWFTKGLLQVDRVGYMLVETERGYDLETKYRKEKHSILSSTGSVSYTNTEVVYIRLIKRIFQSPFLWWH